MKFKIDENLPAELKTDLIAAGYDAETVVDENLAGAPDPQLVQVVQRDDRILLTMDKGIADVRAYPPDQYAGIILLRPRTQGRAATLAFVRRHLPELLRADLSGRLLVVSDSGIRIR
jgi:predicted nuclease of predicted toxin-antitoxin system